MKLWIKLTLLLTLIINLVIQIGLFYVNAEVRGFSVSLVGEKLKSIAASIASGIDGDKLNTFNLYDSSATQSEYYLFVNKSLEHAKEFLSASHSDYNVTLLDKYSIAFGVTLNRVSSLADSLQELGAEIRNSIEKVMNSKSCEFSDIYTDRYGSWQSGFSPVIDSDGRVSGIIEVDQHSGEINDKIDEINNTINIGRLYSLPITILFSVILSAVFLMPINKVKEKILRISKGDYTESKELRAGGEIKQLMEAAENLRLTILEQQTKIFNSIKEIETERDKAEASDRMKSEFLAVISHEIRTPLNVILGNIEVLKLELSDKEPLEIDEIVKNVKFGSDRLIRTVEMIVMYSELISDSYSISEKYINLNEILSNSAVRYKREAEEKGLKFVETCSLITGKVKTDGLLLSEALEQILNNAIKFTQSGTIELCAENSANGIIVSVKDTGIGISDEFRQHLFKPFRQEDMSYQRSYEGNGLGLALAKKCCDSIGVSLEIESKKESGTTVNIVIPKSKLFSV